MRAIQKLWASLSVEAIAEELYDCWDPVTNAVDAEKRAGAAAALRNLNPTLPENSTPVVLATTPFVRLPRIPRIPFRVPPTSPTGLRGALDGLGLRNIEVVAWASLTWLQGKLAGFSGSDVERAHRVARLMRVDGVDRDAAVFLYTHATTPLRTPGELAAVVPATLKAMVQAHVASGFSTTLLDERAWNAWRRYAKWMTQTRKSVAVRYQPMPYPSRQAERVAAQWAAYSSDSGRSIKERKSAATMCWVMSLQAIYLQANETLVRGKATEALNLYRRLYSLLGEQSKAEGLIDGNSPEADGPSLETIMRLSGRLLDGLEESDVMAVRGQIEVRPPRSATDGLRSFTMADLQTSHENTVKAAFGAVDTGIRVQVLAPRVAERVDRLLSDRSRQSLPGTLTIGVQAPNQQARSVDLSTADRAQVRQNVRAATVTSLVNDTGLWNDLRNELDLRSLRENVGSSLGGANAQTVLRSEVAAKYPGVLLQNLGAFDRFIAWSPAGRAGTQYFAPVTSVFAERYRLDMLKPLLTGGDTSLLSFLSVDFADPSRFLMIMPVLFSVHVPVSMSQAFSVTGQPLMAQSLLAALPASATALNVPLTASFADLFSNGLGQVTGPVVDCSAFEQMPQLLWKRIRHLNDQGDAAYQREHLDRAVEYYKKALLMAKQCPDQIGGRILLTLPEVRDDLRERIIDDPFSIQPNEVLRYEVLDTVDPDVILDRFDDMIIWETQPRLATDRLVAKSDMFSRSSLLRRTRFQYYTIVQPQIGSSALKNDPSRRDTIVKELNGTETPFSSLLYYVDYTIGKWGDAFATEAIHAATYLNQLQCGLNWLGFDPDSVPVWRYGWLRENARMYIDRADGFQQRSLSILSQAEDQALSQLQAEANVDIADAQTKVAESYLEMAMSQLEAAQKAEDAAEDQWNRAKVDSWVQGICGVAMVAGAIATGGGSLAANVIAAIGSGVTQTTNTVHGAENAKSNFEVAQAQTEVARNQVGVAYDQVALAELEQQTAKDILDALSNQATNAEHLFALLGRIQDVSRAYLRMANRLAWLAERALQWETRRYTSYIQQNYASATDFAAQYSGAALLLSHLDAMEEARISSTTERYQLLKHTVQLYGVDPVQLQVLKQTGRCLFRLSQEALDQAFPGLYLHSLRRLEVEVDGLLPSGGVQAILRTTNNGMVRVPNSTNYIKDYNEVDEDWAYPGAQFPMGGPNAPAFVMKPMLSTGFTQLLSEYRMNVDGGVLSVPEGALDSFEHLPMDGMWSLEFPTTARTFDPQNVSDVRFVFYFTAQYSPTLHARQREAWVGMQQSRALVLDAATQASASWATWQSQPTRLQSRDIRFLTFGVTQSHLPANMEPTSRHLQNFIVAFDQSGTTPLVLSWRATPNPLPVRVSAVWDPGTLPVDGMVYSAVGDPVVIGEDKDPAIPGIDTISLLEAGDPIPPGAAILKESRLGHFPDLDTWATTIQAGAVNAPDVTGDYVIKVLPEENPDLCLRDDDGNIVEVDGGTLDFSNGGEAVYPGSWTHLSVRAFVRLWMGTLDIHVRNGATGSVRVELSPSTITLTDGVGASITVGLPIMDLIIWTEVQLRVVGTTATLWIDRVKIAELTINFTTAGGVRFLTHNGVSNTLLNQVGGVEVTRYRYNGQALETVLLEDFAQTNAPGWTRNSDCVWTAGTHRILDLSAFTACRFQLDFTGTLLEEV